MKLPLLLYARDKNRGDARKNIHFFELNLETQRHIRILANIDGYANQLGLDSLQA